MKKVFWIVTSAVIGVATAPVGLCYGFIRAVTELCQGKAKNY